MNGVKRAFRSTGKVFLALLGGILVPVLVWVALGAAIRQRGRRAGQAPAPTPGRTSADAGVPRHCWEILHCTPQRREACPSHARREMPGWVAEGLSPSNHSPSKRARCTG